MLPTSSCTTSAGRMPALSLPTVEALRGIVGAGGCLTPGDGDLSSYTDDWAHQFAGAAAAVLWPRSTQEVADIVRLCSREGIAITPQGGNTGRSGGSVPSAHERPNVILCLAKMNRIRKLDPVDNTITADAGVVLKTIQEAAQGIGRYFPLSLGAEGSCQIGGNVATNAGGTAVVRYGNARDLVLGLEVVTAQGEIWNGLRALRKDNAGYDLKSIYMGSEGTLGIITAVVLKLFSRPVEKATAWVATRDLAQAVGLLQLVQGTLDARLTAFEYLSRDEVELILGNPANGVHPLPATEAGGFVLLELSDSVETGTLHGVLESTLGSALERGLALDAAVAVSIRQAEAFWRIRHGVAEANISHGVQILHDISIPIGRIADCVAMLTARIAEAFPDGKTVYVTHLGDGNVHLSVIFPAAFWSKLAAPAEYKREVRRLVYDIVDRYGGTFCAEHGVGQSLVAEMTRYRSAAEIDLLTRIKRALDPANIMNPGKMLDLPAGPRSR